MLLKTKVGKSDSLWHATMLMKTKDLYPLCHDVDEKQGSYSNEPLLGERNPHRFALPDPTR
jgi:hypothetical protein